MPNAHTPERQPDESQAAYHHRRLHSKLAVDRLTLRGEYAAASRDTMNARESQRDAARRNGTLRGGSYGIDLLQPARRRQQQRMATTHPRDEHGAVTFTGSPVEFVDVQPGPGYYVTGGYTGPNGFAKDTRRIWLGGISAQRGY